MAFCNFQSWVIWLQTVIRYILQVNDSKMQRIKELKAKFEEDKRKIQEMRQQRKFKPYQLLDVRICRYLVLQIYEFFLPVLEVSFDQGDTILMLAAKVT